MAVDDQLTVLIFARDAAAILMTATVTALRAQYIDRPLRSAA